MEEQKLQGQRLDVFVLNSGINGGGVVSYFYDVIIGTGGLLGAVTILVGLRALPVGSVLSLVTVRRGEGVDVVP